MVESGLEQMEESLLEGNIESSSLVAVVVFVNEGKEPVTAFFGVAPTFNDADAAGGLAADFVFGEGDAEDCVT